MLFTCMRGYGCTAHPAFPAPSLGSPAPSLEGRAPSVILGPMILQSSGVAVARMRKCDHVIPGRAANPESRDSGSGAYAPSRNDGGWIVASLFATTRPLAQVQLPEEV